ncbi:nitrile hydratase subunit beta [Paraburkholderia youngii]|uniref:nitrile hydratase subunit beta n=1 Tax=Paraburkholderia youngii TaxID=2782701 RepID=UPI0015918693|nr:nitrile hydratase subunit beta [Paraburkholderia youngii]NUX59049.1 nitrile hydratase subunit beta [Paraburkholderia youngii]
MNGIHDMGGMQDMGAIEIEKNEPVFHEPWEGRIYAISRAVAATNTLRIGFRPPIEDMPPLEYLRMSYYERWLASLVDRLVDSGLVTRAEIETGRAAPPGPTVAARALSAAEAPALMTRTTPGSRDVLVAPSFKVGQTVRARNINPVTHTRLPRYARGKSGTIERDNGIFPFPETSVYSKGEKLQHTYLVRLSARELWGKQASPHDSVYIDLWDDYLEPA